MSAKRADRTKVGTAPGRAARTTANVWLSRHDIGLTPRETEEFFQWLREDPRHEMAWENCLMFWRRFDPKVSQEMLFSVYQRRRPVAPAVRG